MMGLIIFIFVLGLSVALPVKCYNDGQYKIKCLEMHGTMEHAGMDNQNCVLGAQEPTK